VGWGGGEEKKKKKDAQGVTFFFVCVGGGAKRGVQLICDMHACVRGRQSTLPQNPYAHALTHTLHMHLHPPPFPSSDPHAYNAAPMLCTKLLTWHVCKAYKIARKEQ
jgi:hypothetical protein